MPGGVHHRFAGPDDLPGDLAVIPGPVHTELGGEQIWRKHGILGWEPGESQCLGVRQTAGTAAKAKQLYITFQLFRHQELHHIEELCAV